MTTSMMGDPGEYRIVDDLTPSRLMAPVRLSLFLAGVTQKVKEDVCEEVNLPVIRMELSRLKAITSKQQAEIGRLTDSIEKLRSAMESREAKVERRANAAMHDADECFFDDVFDNEDDFIKWVMED